MCNTCVTVCVNTHTHTHTWRSQGRSSLSHWRAKFSGLARQRRDRWDHPLWGHTGKIPKPRVCTLFFQRRSRMPSARFTPNEISSYWGSIGMLGELLENLRMWHFHAMRSLRHGNTEQHNLICRNTEQNKTIKYSSYNNIKKNGSVGTLITCLTIHTTQYTYYYKSNRNTEHL